MATPPATTLYLNGLAVWGLAWCWCSIGVQVLDILSIRALNAWYRRRCAVAKGKDDKIGGIAETSAWRAQLVALTLWPWLFAFMVTDPSDMLLRSIVSMAAPFYVLRASQMILEQRCQVRCEPLFYRTLHVGMSFHDSRYWIRRNMVWNERMQVAKHEAIQLVANGIGMGAVSLVLLRGRDYLPAHVGLFTVCLAGGLYAKFSLDVFGNAIALVMAFCGIEVPKLMRQPCSSRDIKEFWGKRWDVVVQEILGTYVYLFMRKTVKAPRPLSVAAVFFCSGLIHIAPVLACFPQHSFLLASVMGYFMAQCALLFIDDMIIPAKSVNIKRLWCYISVTAPLPLIVQPCLVIAGLPSLF